MTHRANGEPRLAPAGSDEEQLRNARLLFDAEILTGAVSADALRISEVRAATRVRRVPSRIVRLSEQIRYELGHADFESAVMRPLLAARRAALGEDRDARPRFLIRVDEFPHYQAWDEPDRFGVSRFERFVEIMSAAGVPYLMAVLPRVSHLPLSPTASGSRALEQDELEMLQRLSGERVSFGLHGRDHRTRYASPRRRSELCGLSPARTATLLDTALDELGRNGIDTNVFVAPYNRFDASQLGLLAERFSIVCGGPESIGRMGLQWTPQWRDGTVYMPCYLPLYGGAEEVLAAVERMIGLAAGLWIPVVLHWGWEAEAGWEALERLVERIAPYAAHWEDFGAAIRRSRGEVGPAAPVNEGSGGQAGAPAEG